MLSRIELPVGSSGLSVMGADGEVGGTVVDVWIDRAEMVARYLEVAVPNAALGPHVLLPVNFTRIGTDGVKVQAVMGHHIAGVPRLKNPDQVSAFEEDRICAYFGAGTLYASPERMEPLV